MTPSTRRDGGIFTRKLPRSLRSLRRRMVALTPLVSAGICTTASAQPGGGIDKDTELDGRLFGYDAKVAIEKDSTTPLWFVYFFLVVVGCSAMFKTAKRE